MMPGMPAFWTLAGTQTRRLTWGRARGRRNSCPKRTARKPARKRKSNKTANSSVWWPGSRARACARQKARKPTRKKQGPRSTRASHSKSKTDRTTAHRSAQQFLTVFTAFYKTRAQHRRHARQRLAPKCANMRLAYIPPRPSKEQCFLG